MRIPFVGPIVVVGLLQLLTWGGGFLTMAMMIKAYERAGGNAWGGRVGTVLENGYFFAGISMAWILWASWDLEVNEASNRSLKFHVWTGVGMLVVIYGYLDHLLA